MPAAASKEPWRRTFESAGPTPRAEKGGLGLKERIKQSITGLIKQKMGPEIWNRFRCAMMGVHSSGERLYLSVFKRAYYKAIRQPIDVAFCLDRDGWALVRPVALNFLQKNPHLRVAFLVRGPKSALPADVSWDDKLVFDNIEPHTRKLFNTTVLFAPFLEFARAWKAPNSILVHPLHTMASLDGMFPEFYFDQCDYIMCAGPHQLESFRNWSKRRPALAGKKLVRAGYPKLDAMLERSQAGRGGETPRNAMTVVYAPTLGHEDNLALASLRRNGQAIVKGLLGEGFDVIFRPHPASMMSMDKSSIDRICEEHSSNPRFSLDTRKDYFQSYRDSDLMVTDLSGTGFTYSLSFDRPCIFFGASEEAEAGLTGIQFEDRHRIGKVVRSVDDLVQSVKKLRSQDMQGEIKSFREEFVFNIGRSAEFISTSVSAIVAQSHDVEWTHL